MSSDLMFDTTFDFNPRSAHLTSAGQDVLRDRDTQLEVSDGHPYFLGDEVDVPAFGTLDFDVHDGLDFLLGVKRVLQGLGCLGEEVI